MASRPWAAVCYSGFRRGQSPDQGRYPSEAQVREDLHLLAPWFGHLRLYDCDELAETALRVIAQDRLPFEVMLGAWLAAEESNPRCPWGGVHPESVLAANRAHNERRIGELAAMARRYPGIVTSVSAGNEATVEWTDHLVPVERVTEFVRALRASAGVPVTFCENHVPWVEKLQGLAAELDFVSLHTYPVWEQRRVDEAMAVTRQNLADVRAALGEKPVVITEAGWTTSSNGRGILPENAGEEEQERHLGDLLAWSRAEGVRTYLFEAFDEPWKGSDHPDEPEKHWGLWTEAREPKAALRSPRVRELLAAAPDGRAEAGHG